MTRRIVALLAVVLLLSPIAAQALPTAPPEQYDLLRHTSGLVYGSFTPNAQLKELYARANADSAGTLAAVENLYETGRASLSSPRVRNIPNVRIAHDSCLSMSEAIRRGGWMRAAQIRRLSLVIVALLCLASPRVSEG